MGKVVIQFYKGNVQQLELKIEVPLTQPMPIGIGEYRAQVQHIYETD